MTQHRILDEHDRAVHLALVVSLVDYVGNMTTDRMARCQSELHALCHRTGAQ